MVLTAHVAIGIALSQEIHNPLISWPASFGFHFLGDLVPHWDALTGSSKEKSIQPWRWILMILDIVCGLTLGLFFVFRALWFFGNAWQALNILGACFLSVLPDLVELPHVLLGKSNKISLLMLSIQRKIHIKQKLPWGFVTQILVIALAVFLAF